MNEVCSQKVIALAGNPNVGKSTVFNSLTGLKQHTGNWPGKTVAKASGNYTFENQDYSLIDLPGTYSLMAHSAEEEITRNFICFENPDAVIVVCDATCLERNLNLVLQTLEITPNVIVCINLMDEAKKKKITVDLEELSRLLRVPVIATVARGSIGLTNLMKEVATLTMKPDEMNPFTTVYSDELENLIANFESQMTDIAMERLMKIVSTPSYLRFLILRLLEGDTTLLEAIKTYFPDNIELHEEMEGLHSQAQNLLLSCNLTVDYIKDLIVERLMQISEHTYRKVVHYEEENYDRKDRRLDRILTGKYTGVPIMLLLLLGIFWLTMTGANYPSKVLSNLLFGLQDVLLKAATTLGIPVWIKEMLILGVYRTLAWVVSVMLPPMAIFFPLFTLLEDSGYLPRVAFNLDHHFKKACACGKQALTMCMGVKDLGRNLYRYRQLIRV
ncbi:MAG TPA: FeoB small GTPase domain-containing protein [Lachnospiraceae bacterium]|nr:FeoB small GTPase domain-containing protein [Lachnospiraceae bacterium]HEX3078166.1 FeoB small GTPase domain-containing protein [Lachnospiraceae bacterium]